MNTLATVRSQVRYMYVCVCNRHAVRIQTFKTDWALSNTEQIALCKGFGTNSANANKLSKDVGVENWQENMCFITGVKI